MKNRIMFGVMFAAVLSLSANAAQLVEDNSNVNQATLMANQSHSININTAGVEELVQLNGIGEVKAQAIVEFRQQHGQFSAIEELEKVNGISAKLVEKNKAMIML
ncbi:helix-hairpin-helix domain-containing protein [Shewanella sp. VB17]|uniref:ComEA family DNA-binding protein n=1 Tax=Shewanella sp. VB17 TaxID=2739432 RepID=UPI0015667723|nr:ComEA family DNA-binding protein [Shewanella sp. VB17]NRD73502.1 helix-hairpin-helix domain-containing protein [Shewanella sp. VB17]